MEHCRFPVLKKSKCMKIVVIFYFNSTFNSCIDDLHEDNFNIMPKKGHVTPQENQLNQICPRIKNKNIIGDVFEQINHKSFLFNSLK